MKQVELQVGPNLIQNLQTFRTVMAAASGFLFWVPIVIFVSVEHSRQNFYTLTRILIPLLILYFFIFFIKNFLYRTLANLAIFVTFYLFLIFFGEEIQSRIIPFGIIYLAAVLLISFGLKLKFALPAIALVLTLEYFTATRVGEKLILGGAVFNLELFILYHFIIAIVAFTFTNTLEKELNFIDKETIKFANDNRDYEKLIYQRELLRNLKSKIHGTLLNNLSLISQNRFKVTSDGFLDSLKEDLADTKSIESEIGDISLADIFSQVSKANSHVDFSLEINTIPEVFLSRNLALDLKELLIEVLRNVDRHAKANSVAVDVSLKNQRLYFTINDDGIGPDSISSPKLGLSTAIFETLHALDGKIIYSGNLPTGTTTKIEFPVSENISLKNLSEEELTRKIFPVRLKAAFLLPHIVLAIYFLTDPVVRDNPVIYVLHAIAASFLFFSLFPDIAKIKPIFPTLFLISSLVLFWQVSKIYQACETAGGWHWIITTYTIGFIFYLGYQKDKFLRWLGLPIFLTFMFYISYSLPSNCTEIIRLPLFNSTIAGIGFALSLIIFYRQVKVKIKLYEATYKSENLIAANKVFIKLAKSNWDTNPETGIELISKAVKNSKVLEDSEFIKEAKLEQARLRSLLTIDPLAQSQLNEQIIEIIRIANSYKNVFELEFHGPQEFNPKVPDAYFELVSESLKIPHSLPIQSKIFSSPTDLQVSLIMNTEAFEETAARLNFKEPKFENWVLETEKIFQDGQERIWFLLSYSRTSDELAHFAQTSSTQIANQ
jgi:hypothetical protein